MKGKKCWKCRYWTKYFNSNQYFCKRGYCKNQYFEEVTMKIAKFQAVQCDTRYDRPMKVVCGADTVGIACVISLDTDNEPTVEYLLQMAKEIEALPPVEYKDFKNVKPIL